VQLNLPAGALSVVATLLVLVSPFAKFALTLEPVAQGADRSLGITPRTPFAPLAMRAVRTGLAGGALVLAAKVPFFGAFMAILGSFLTLTVSVIFPCMAHLKLGGQELSARERGIDAGIIGVGIFATVAGTTTSVQSLLANPAQAAGFADMMPHLMPDGPLHKLMCSSVCYMN
jgi:solute carrier family 32 (vesicular inhibitory amino acid transporter)